MFYRYSNNRFYNVYIIYLINLQKIKSILFYYAASNVMALKLPIEGRAKIKFVTSFYRRSIDVPFLNIKMFKEKNNLNQRTY